MAPTPVTAQMIHRPQGTRYYAEEPDSPGHTPVYVETPNGTKQELDKRLDLANHSPDGFSWGYRGSGPSQLALAVLADYANDAVATDHYRDFAREWVADYNDEAPFYITARELNGVLKLAEAHG